MIAAGKLSNIEIAPSGSESTDKRPPCEYSASAGRSWNGVPNEIEKAPILGILGRPLRAREPRFGGRAGRVTGLPKEVGYHMNFAFFIRELDRSLEPPVVTFSQPPYHVRYCSSLAGAEILL